MCLRHISQPTYILRTPYTTDHAYTQREQQEWQPPRTGIPRDTSSRPKPSITNNQLIGTKPNPVRWTRGPLTFPTLYGGTRLVAMWVESSQETEKCLFSNIEVFRRYPRTWRQLRLRTLRTAYVVIQIFYLFGTILRGFVRTFGFMTYGLRTCALQHVFNVMNFVGAWFLVWPPMSRPPPPHPGMKVGKCIYTFVFQTGAHQRRSTILYKCKQGPCQASPPVEKPLKSRL